MRIRFNEDRDVRDHLGVVVQSFRAGEVVELSTASARHWLNRNAAELVRDTTPLGKGEVAKKPPANPRPEEEVKPATDAFDKYREKEIGPSRETGPDKPPSASPADPASSTKTSSTSGEPENKDDAKSEPSTKATSASPSRTSSTPRTRAGGGRRRTPKASKAKK